MKDCTQCGKCCIKYSDGDLSASDGDIEMWRLFNPDIAEYVKGGLIWFSPNSGKRLALCPFLRGVTSSDTGKTLYSCDIYHDRPEDCRFYPVTVKQMMSDDCEMLEPQDLHEPIKAQADLDTLLRYSRPSFD
ncbi:YkgJ family cysteine cluster protein [Paraglaciecola aquimarina]|uniref:YkgJ family cysteine cluster protein n=1 Tax=Paraglaciecola aquimarina TaxID=1235557 RepID=A0ABU3SXY3_9ALTE|nr:YkgJ family cysteine cluster protein [Paraglaciecola aquimarina]MDU0354865.1 YkgJ family cysteine cluster protein [Paraglaciecola aquimarina]